MIINLYHRPTRETRSFSSSSPTSTMADKVHLVLYDAETKKGSFSPYALRSRMALNYKKLNFKTEWLPLSGIKEAYEKIGIPPTPHRAVNPHYTVPALIDTSVEPPAIISQSFNIDKYLDEKFPEPPLWFVRPPNVSDEDSQKKLAFLEQLSEILQGRKDERITVLFALVIPHVPNILLDVDVPYFKESRAQWYQKPFDEIGPKDQQEALDTVKDMFDGLSQFLDSYRGNPFNPEDPLEQPWVLVDEVSWGDFALAGMFSWVQVSCPPIWEEMKTWQNGRWLRLINETAQWR